MVRGKRFSVGWCCVIYARSFHIQIYKYIYGFVDGGRLNGIERKRQKRHRKNDEIKFIYVIQQAAANKL